MALWRAQKEGATKGFIGWLIYQIDALRLPLLIKRIHIFYQQRRFKWLITRNFSGGLQSKCCIPT